MTNRKGFTLTEVVLALFIFGFMSMSLATIYATANRHMFQNYRRNIIKTNADFAMKLIQNTLSTATRLDRPAAGAAGNELAFASNVDQASNRYPISAADNADWHYFCVALVPDPDPGKPPVNTLFYHTGRIWNGAGGVPATSCLNPGAATFGAGSYPVAFCGPGGGGTVTMLMQHVAPPDPPRSAAAFSRSAVDGVREAPAVRITLRSRWLAGPRGFGAGQRDIDFTLDSVMTANRAAQ